MAKEAESDLGDLAGLHRSMSLLQPSRVDGGSAWWEGSLSVGFGLTILGGGIWGIVAPWVTDVSIWWPTLLGIIGVPLGILVVLSGVQSPENHRVARRVARREDYAALRDLGIDARVVVQGGTQAEPTWIEKGDISVGEGPIQWIRYTLTGHSPPRARHFHVTDRRLPSEGREVGRMSIHSKRMRRFLVFGPVREVRWLVGQLQEHEETGLASSVATSLAKNAALSEKIRVGGVNFRVAADPRRGCWVLADDKMRTLTKPLWDSYQAVAEALLSMPLLADE